MTAKRILLMPRIWIRRSKAKVKAFLDRRTQRERLWIIVGMLVYFCSSRHLAAYRWAVYGEAAEADGTYTIN